MKPLISAFSLLLLLILNSSAQIHLSGYLSGVLVDTTYIVDDNISVNAGDALTILPGAEFYFNGLTKFTINGYLFAVGTEQDSIKFIQPDSGIAFNGDGIMKYCLIRDSFRSGLSSNSEPLIENCSIINNDFSGVYFAWNYPQVPILKNCLIENNYTPYDGGGGVFCINVAANITGCVIKNNTAAYHGGGIYCSGAMTIDSCTITGNYAGGNGGGIYNGIGSNHPTITNSVIRYNNSGASGDGIYCYNSSLTGITVENCVISDNFETGIWLGRNTGGLVFQTIKNSIFTGNGIGLFFSASYDRDIYNNDFYGNNTSFAGSLPGGIGVITGNNINGDPCDIYGNIFLNPLFVNPGDDDYHLQSGSPCIDAGEINAAHIDPDYTITDMGAYFFPQSANFSVDLEPINPPIIIPALGGSFCYNLTIANANSACWILDIWKATILPNGQMITLPITSDRIFPGNINISRDSLEQNVQERAPAGNYNFIVRLGIFPDTVFTEDALGFAKAEQIDNELLANASGTQINFNMAISPNPFNPITNISYNLLEAGNISLIIYNVAGREVAKLADGFYASGEHSITFNASALSSGIYFAKLSAGNFQQTQKILLIK